MVSSNARLGMWIAAGTALLAALLFADPAFATPPGGALDRAVNTLASDGRPLSLSCRSSS